MTRIVCQQFAPRIADLPANRQRSVRAVAEAIDAGADVVVLPELVTSGYVFESTDEATSVAITPRHAVFTDWAAEAARGPAVVVGGFCEQGDDGLLYKTSSPRTDTPPGSVRRRAHRRPDQLAAGRPAGGRATARGADRHGRGPGQPRLH